MAAILDEGYPSGSWRKCIEKVPSLQKSYWRLCHGSTYLSKTCVTQTIEKFNVGSGTNCDGAEFLLRQIFGEGERP